MTSTNNTGSVYTIEDWNDIYNRNKSPSWRDAGRDEYFTQDICSKFQIKQSDVILEYGCDRGIIGEFFLQHGMGVDFAEIADIPVKKLRQKFGDKSQIFQVSEPKEIDKKYDLIICSCVIHHLPPQQKRDFIRQFYDKLNDGGKLWISAIASDDHTVIKTDGNFSTARHKPYLIDEQTIENMTKDSGFEFSDVDHISFKLDSFKSPVNYWIISLTKPSENESLKEKSPDIIFDGGIRYSDSRLEKIKNLRQKQKEHNDSLQNKESKIKGALRGEGLEMQMGKTAENSTISQQNKKVADTQIAALRKHYGMDK